MTELADVFAELDDPRAVNARRHSLHEILVIALCTVISGGHTCTGMELCGHAKAVPATVPKGVRRCTWAAPGVGAGGR